MKRVVLAAALVLGVSGLAFAHFPPGVTYPIFQFPDELRPTIDGDLSDWDIVPEAYTIPIDLMGERLAGMTEPDYNDFNCWLKLGWNKSDNKLYVASWTYDNVHLVPRPSGEITLMWQQDDFEIMTDMDHSGGQYKGWSAEQIPDEEERKLAEGRQAQQYACAYPQADGVYAVSFDYATWTTEAPYWEAGFTFDGTLNGPGTTTYEVRMTTWDEMIYYGPDQSTEHKFKEGEIVGLQFSYGDFDDPENPTQYHAFWTVSHQDATFKFAERFCDFLVAPLEVKPAVEANTWGRIKASFE